MGQFQTAGASIVCQQRAVSYSCKDWPQGAVVVKIGHNSWTESNAVTHRHTTRCREAQRDSEIRAEVEWAKES